MQAEADRLEKPLKLISYGFTFPVKEPIKMLVHIISMSLLLYTRRKRKYNDPMEPSKHKYEKGDISGSILAIIGFSVVALARVVLQFGHTLATTNKKPMSTAR